MASVVAREEDAYAVKPVVPVAGSAPVGSRRMKLMAPWLVPVAPLLLPLCAGMATPGEHGDMCMAHHESRRVLISSPRTFSLSTLLVSSGSILRRAWRQNHGPSSKLLLEKFEPAEADEGAAV